MNKTSLIYWNRCLLRSKSHREQKNKLSTHLVDKVQNIQLIEKLLKAARQKDKVTYKDISNQITDFSMETSIRKTQISAMQVLKEHSFQSRQLYPSKMSIIIEWERNAFHIKNRFN